MWRERREGKGEEGGKCVGVGVGAEAWSMEMEEECLTVYYVLR